MLKSAKASLSGFVLASSIACMGHAATLYSTGFENPPFNAGNLNNQDGFLRYIAGSGTPGTGVVETTVVSSGSQAVQLDKTANEDTSFDRSAPYAPSGTNQFVNVQFDLRYTASTQTNQFGPFFGVSTFNGSQANPIGSAGVDSKTGEVLIVDPAQGIQPDTADTTITPGVFHNFLLSLNYTTQKYLVYVDGVLVTTQNGGIGFDTAQTAFTDASLATFAASPTAADQAATGTGYFDNFSITYSNTVPEPVTAGVVGLGLFGLSFRRRRSFLTR